MPATLKNVSKQPVTVILDHPAFHKPDSGWSRGTAKFARTLADGSRELVEERRSTPGTITLMPGQTSEPLHDAIANVRQVQNLKSAGVLALETVVEKKANKPDAGGQGSAEEKKLS